MKNTLQAIVHLVRADFLERVRRYSFLITLGVTVFAAYSLIPPAGARYATVDLGGYRGVYNSAWIGCTVALVTTLFLALVGFYLVKNAVERDLQTGVGQIIATTPLRKPLYTLGKTLSNFAVLAVMVGLIAVASDLPDTDASAAGAGICGQTTADSQMNLIRRRWTLWVGHLSQNGLDALNGRAPQTIPV